MKKLHESSIDGYIDKTLFSGTHKYYADYRPGIPDEAKNLIRDYFSLKRTDHMLDLGCGTGQVALAFFDSCEGYTGLDPDRELLLEAESATKNIADKIKLKWLNARAEDLPSFYDQLGTYKLVTFCRSFHWMDKSRVLENLDPLVLPEGGIAIMSDGSLWAGSEVWQKRVKSIVQKYLGEERKAGQGTFKESNESWEDLIARSPFGKVVIKEISVNREWTSDSIVGCLFSSSFATPAHFGEDVGRFENEIRAALKELDPKEIFQEDVAFQIIMGKRV
jgi:ubiquinone/menaquinone biosynthesis C-methylase UbiE